MKADRIPAVLPVTFQPLGVPNFVLLEVPGAVEGSSVPVSALPQSALDDLAERYLRDLYDKAQKRNPYYKQSEATR